MQVPIVRFSRPLLLMTDRNQYKTIYGFVFQDKDWQEDIYTVIKFYVGYLCGVADFTNGGDEFSVSFDLKGILNWVDDRGVLHQGTDAWMKEIGSRCMKKLNLNYAIFRMWIDNATYADCVDEEGFIVSEDLFDDMELYITEGFGDNDDWPFCH